MAASQNLLDLLTDQMQDPVNMILSDDDENEQPWDKKKDLIFWRGATTGGGSSPPGFLAQYQRHR